MPAADLRDRAAERAPRGRIAAVGSAFPPHSTTRRRCCGALKERWAERHFNLDRLEQLHRNVLVGGRHLALPIEEYDDARRLRRRQRRLDPRRRGGRRGRRSLDGARAGRRSRRRRRRASSSSPSPASRRRRSTRGSSNRLGLRPDVKRMPIFGLGCVAGAAGIARAADYVRGYPDEVAVLLSVELCSLTLQRDDLSIPNLIASGLFGDGAAAAIVAGAARTEPAALAGPRDRRHPLGLLPRHRARDGLGHRRPRLPDRALGRRARGRRGAPARATSTRFLADHGLTRADIASWVCHPGGPKVLEAMARALDAAARTRSSSPGRACARSATSRRPRCSSCSRRRSRIATGAARGGQLRPAARDGARLLLRARAAAMVALPA